MEEQFHASAEPVKEFHRCSIKENNMADIKTNKKSFMNLRMYFREYCDYTGIHGLKYIGEKRSLCEKISWTLIFCLSLFTCISVVYEVFKKWQKSPIIVNFASEQKNIFDITFPAVTICPETKVLGDYFNYSLSVRMYENNTIPEDQVKKLQYMSLLCDVNRYTFKIKPIDIIDEGFYDFMKNGAPSFLTKCSWMGEEYPCDTIFQPLITDEGLCVTFNMLSKKEMYTSEVFIKKNIDDPPSSYHDHMAQNWSADYGYTAKAGIVTYPRRAVLSGSTNALEVLFSLNNTDIDYGCTHFQGYKTDRQLKYYSKYSQLNCQSECLMNLTLKSCGCVQFFMPRNISMPICGIAKDDCLKKASARQAYLLIKSHLEYNRANEEFEKHYKEKINKVKSEYFCNCPDMCNSIDYNVEITESDYDWPRKMAALGIDVVAEDIEGMSSSQLQVYFKTNTFIPQERSEVYGTFDFLANVGGLLGLFIGFSLLSMIEFIYFLSLRIICNINLYNAWYGKPEYKPKNSMIEAVTVMK